LKTEKYLRIRGNQRLRVMVQKLLLSGKEKEG